MQAIKNYDMYLRGQMKSDNTRKSYISAVNRLVSHGNFSCFSEITPAKITAFRLALATQGVGGTSINSNLVGIRSFLHFAHRNGYIPADYSLWEECKGIKKSTAENKRGKRQFNDPEEPGGKSMPKKHRERLLSVAVNNKRACGKLKSTEGERNALMLEIGFVCGFRVGDLVKLKPANFDIMAGRVEITAEKTKRKVKFHVGKPLLLSRIRDYIEFNRLRKNDYLFPTNRSAHMTTAAFWSLFKSLLLFANLPAGKENDGYAPHDLRRTCATELYNAGVPLKDISLRLGHSSVTITEKYLRLTDTTENIKRTQKAVLLAFG